MTVASTFGMCDRRWMIEVRPAHDFEGMATMLGPKKPESSVCWCLSWRLSSKENRSLAGVLAYLDGDPVGWAGIAPRSELHPFEHSRKIPHVDDLPAWSLWCLRVRPGFRGTGVTRALIEGGVDYARANGAPVVESYPVDSRGGRVDTTMAFVGTRAMFERAGFVKVADTDSVSGGIPRIVMRRALD
jgi:GNAT superfamily N-acetyltransferase